jgi:hypothetical protein
MCDTRARAVGNKYYPLLVCLALAAVRTHCAALFVAESRRVLFGSQTFFWLCRTPRTVSGLVLGSLSPCVGVPLVSLIGLDRCNDLGLQIELHPEASDYVAKLLVFTVGYC